MITRVMRTRINESISVQYRNQESCLTLKGDKSRGFEIVENKKHKSGYLEFLSPELHDTKVSGVINFMGAPVVFEYSYDTVKKHNQIIFHSNNEVKLYSLNKDGGRRIEKKESRKSGELANLNGLSEIYC